MRWLVISLYAPWFLGAFFAGAACLMYGSFLGALFNALVALFAGYKIRRLVTGRETAGSWDSWAIAALDVFVVLCVLIALPGYRGLFRKSKEGALKNTLASLRGAYRAHPDGPAEIPQLELPGIAHPASNDVRYASAPEFKDGGTWLVVRSLLTPGPVSVYIDCTHTDTRGSYWSSY